MRYSTIIVGTDGSESALKAVEQAAEIAAALSVRLIVVCAYHPLTAKEQSILAAVIGPISMYQVAGTDAAKEALGRVPTGIVGRPHRAYARRRSPRCWERR